MFAPFHIQILKHVRFNSTVFACLLLQSALAAWAQNDTNILNVDYLERLRASVRAEHPSIAAAQARLRAADAGTRSVRLWEDPMVGLGIMAADVDMRRDDGDLMFSVEQTLPRRKLYEAEKSRARAERSAAAAEAESIALKLETSVTQTAIELALANEMIGTHADELDWLDTMAVNARERLKDPGGVANASEALRIESELAQQRQRHDSDVLMRRRVTRQLNILLGRPADDPWPAIRLPAGATNTPALDAQLTNLVAANPMLQRVASEELAARSGIEVARRQSKPVFSVGVDTRVYSGGIFRETTVGAKMTIPLFNRSLYRANVQRAEEQRESAEREIEALDRELRSQVVSAYTEAENAERQVETVVNELIPRAQAAAASIQNAWITSKATLLETLEARRAVVNARLERSRLVAAHYSALETLRSLVPPKPQP